MADITNVTIVIQARSGSKRFPQKCMAEVAGKPLLRHVIDSCKGAADYLNRNVTRNKIMVTVTLAIPEGDTVVGAFRQCVAVVEGSAQDVLARYKLAADRFQPDYIVRITGDCPLVPQPLICNAIKTAVMNKYDYLSNVDTRVRSAPDGWDCEVFSRNLLNFTHENATDADDREHVTTFMRRCPPSWATSGHLASWFGLALGGLKLSIDTPDDLERVRPLIERAAELNALSHEIFGKSRVHRF
jgi:spore coat polysaccharide biosynthesis protein SpsF (cytidylyltransferase family)